MISILIEYSEDIKEFAIKAGFAEKKVLVRFDGFQSTEENKEKLEAECRGLNPYQFLVGDFWGEIMTDLEIKRFKNRQYYETQCWRKGREKLMRLRQRLINTVKMQFEMKWKL